MELGLLLLGVIAAMLGAVVAVTLGFRGVEALEARRVNAYQRWMRPWLTEYAVGSREDPPPPPKGRLQMRTFRQDLRALAPRLKGSAVLRLDALFADSGLVQVATRELGSRNALTRLRACDTLATMHAGEATWWLRSRLDHADPLLRLACARALADLGAAEALGEVVDALGELHAYRVEAVNILLGFGPAAIPELRERLREGPSDQLGLAASALGELRAAEATPELTEELSSEDDELAAAAARALGRIGAVSATGALVEVLTGERTWFVKVAAANALASVGDPAAAPALLAVLDAEEWDLRNSAAHALVAMGDDGLRAVTGALEGVPDRALAHHAGVLDLADRLERVIRDAAEGDEALERYVRRSAAAGVSARLEELAGDGQTGRAGRFAREMLEATGAGTQRTAS